MTPSQLRILVDAHLLDVVRVSESQAGQASALINDGMLYMTEESITPSALNVGPTERGQAFINYICSLPYPVQKWDMPEKAS